MKVSRKWLNQLVNISDIETSLLAETLTNAGLEVESVQKLAQATNLVIGQVLECEPHPDSDHLHVTKTKVSEDEVLQIVCGAANVKQGQKVIVALVGAKLPALEIKPTVIRQVESFGMLCSLKELGIGENYLTEADKAGIKVLSTDAIIGHDPLIYLGLDDEILEIKQTPNRSDFNAMQSIAYEVAALFEREVFKQPIIEEIHAGQKSDFKVSIQTENCNSLWIKELKGLTIGPSPLWIQQALRASGIVPHNNLVDISNLVMLETGQPNHFYDARFFETNEISVVEGIHQTVVSLDQESYDLVDTDLVITSQQQPIGIAGIKGLGNSMVLDDTIDIVVECARFNPVSIAKTSKRLGLISESSIRFSKPLDDLSQSKALQRILALLTQYAGLKSENIYETIQLNHHTYQPISVSVTLDQINDLLGTQFQIGQVMDIFQRLNFSPLLVNDTIVCNIPSYRQDLLIKEDLIEEVIRLAGYDCIESSYPLQPLTMGELNQKQKQWHRIEDTLISVGLNQIESYTLVSKRHTQSVMALGEAVEILAPLSENRQFVRNSLSQSLVDTLSYNLDYKNQNETYFELSEVYATNLQSATYLGIIGSGIFNASAWQKQFIQCDFYTVKGLCERVFSALGINLERISYVENDLDYHYYHPHQSAKVALDGQFIGLIGVLHPSLGIKQGMMAEINLTRLFDAKKAKTRFEPLLKYPSVKRDIAVVVDKQVNVGELVKVIKKAGKAELVQIQVFDVFELGLKKSIAIGLVFESKTHTFTEKEISDKVQDILKNLEKSSGALLR